MESVLELYVLLSVGVCYCMWQGFERNTEAICYFPGSKCSRGTPCDKVTQTQCLSLR